MVLVQQIQASQEENPELQRQASMPEEPDTPALPKPVKKLALNRKKKGGKKAK